MVASKDPLTGEWGAGGHTMVTMTKPRTLLARDMMVKPYAVRPGDRVYDVVKTLTRRRYSGAPVVDAQRKVIGMLSERDAIKALLNAVVEQLPSHTVEQVMDTKLTTIPPETHVLTVAHLFLHKNLRRIPVVDREGVLIGQISRSDLLRRAIDVFEASPNRKAALLYLSALEGTIPPT